MRLHSRLARLEQHKAARVGDCVCCQGRPMVGLIVREGEPVPKTAPRCVKCGGEMAVLVIDEAVTDAHFAEMQERGDLWQDEAGRWYGSDSTETTTPPYTDGERAQMMAEVLNRLDQGARNE